MKTWALVAVLCLAAYSSPVPNQSATKPDDAGNGKRELPLTVVNNCSSSAEAQKEPNSSPRRGTSIWANVPNWLLVLVGILTFVAVWKQAVQTKEAAKATRDIAVSSRDTAEKQLRAYLCTSEAMLKFIMHDTVEAQVHIKNCGQTPAHDVIHWIHTWTLEYPLRIKLPLPPDGFKMSKSVLGPGQHHIMVSEPYTVPQDVIPMFGTTLATIYVYGEIRYRDIFDKEWITKYRLIYGGSGIGRKITKDGIERGLLQPDTEGNEAT